MTEMGNASQLTLETLSGAHSGCDYCADLPHPIATHCKKCHASWRRTTNTMHCAGCHRTFSTPSACDLHLLTRGCTDPADVVFKHGAKQGERKFADPKPNSFGTLVWRGAGEWKPEGAA